MISFRNVLALVVVSGSALADGPRHPELAYPLGLLSGDESQLELVINGNARFDVISPLGASYNAGTGVVQFDVSGKLVCFDFHPQPATSAVALRVRDPNGDLILADTRLRSALQYQPGPRDIRFTPAPETPCFYRTHNNFLGLNGQPKPEPIDDGAVIFANRFELTTNIELEFLDVPQFARIGDPFQYRIRIRNTGLRDVARLGFQELYPRNADFFAGQLAPGFYFCDVTGGAQCVDAAPTQGRESIRGQNMVLPAGSSITFRINRFVWEESALGSTIVLDAAAIAGDLVASPPAYDTAQAVITVIGIGEAIAGEVVNPQLPVADGLDQVEIRITALDNSPTPNPVPDVLVQVQDADGLQFVQNSGTTDSTGTVSFLASTQAAGSYQPGFLAPSLPGGPASTTVAVDFAAGAPTQISASGPTTPLTANGISTALFEVEVRDTFENLVAAEAVTVTDSGGMSFADTTVLTDADGVAVFQATSTNAGTFNAYFSVADSLTTSASAEFVAGPPAQIMFLVAPTDGVAGEPIEPAIEVVLLDANDNPVFSDNSTEVTLLLRQGTTVVPGFLHVVAAQNGVAVFDNVVVNTAGLYSLSALASGVPNVSSDEFEIVDPAPPDGPAAGAAN